MITSLHLPNSRRLLWLVLALVASTASSFAPQTRTTFVSRRGIVQSKSPLQPFLPPEMMHPKSLQKRQSSYRHPSAYSSSSSALQIGIFPHADLLLSHDTIMLAQQLIQTEITKTSTNLLTEYSHLLQVYPISTKAITAAILACTGDAIAQKRSESDVYDVRRGIGFLLFGALYTGTFQHFWFNYMSQNIAHWGDVFGIWGPERVVFPVDSMFDLTSWWKYFDVLSQLQNPPSPQVLAAGKVVLNQFIIIPTIYMPLFFAFTGLVSGLDSKESLARARSLYFPLLQRNWFYWLPMQFLQFLVIPVDFQIPFVSAASLIWTIILSSIGSGSTAPSAASSIVVYDTLSKQDEFGDETGETVIVVSKVESGPANEITDDVLLEDVEKALFPELLREVVADSRTQLATGGLATGLLAAAADEGAIGAAIAGGAGATGVGVAVVAAVGAGLGLLAASASSSSSTNKHNHHNNAEGHDNNNDIATSTLELENDNVDTVSLNRPTMLSETEAIIMPDQDFVKPTRAVLEEEQQDMASAPLR